MLVFISDIHLTDGTSGETIKSGAFEKFVLTLKNMAIAAEAEDIEIVLLGDIFDVIRSDHWLRSGIRPWSSGGDTDGEDKGLQEYTLEIVEKICGNSNNIQSMEHLKAFKDKMKKKGIAVRLTYITGNHDWLINRYPKAREMIAGFLGMENPAQYQNEPFTEHGFWEAYKVFARHGDIYDPFNFDGNRNASSLGDVIVIDLINRFPRAVENKIGEAADPELILQIKEIDNVRPLVDIPLWIQGASRRARSIEIREQVKAVWNDLVDGFLEIDFVKAHDKAWQIDIVDALQLCLKITKFLSLGDIANLPLRKFQKTEKEYREKAFHENHMRRNEAEYVLFGHTHGYKIEPLDQVLMAGQTLRKTYFNTGTWRKVHVRTAFDVGSLEFINWHVMTFIAFYLEHERGHKRFEVWNGALG